MDNSEKQNFNKNNSCPYELNLRFPPTFICSILSKWFYMCRYIFCWSQLQPFLGLGPCSVGHWDRWVRILLETWMFVLDSLCCAVLFRQKPCDGLITRPRSSTKCINRSSNFPYGRRPRLVKGCRVTDNNDKYMFWLWVICVNN